jgi:hypothetical protein
MPLSRSLVSQQGFPMTDNGNSISNFILVFASQTSPLEASTARHRRQQVFPALLRLCTASGAWLVMLRATQNNETDA